ncbi:hypothetical protein CBL_08604 [Carabus blaptoides fortunei]
MALLVETCITNLIEEIEKRPALYKKSLKEYSDANLKKKLWVEVCEVVVPDWNVLSAEDKTKEGTNILPPQQSLQYSNYTPSSTPSPIPPVVQNIRNTSSPGSSNDTTQSYFSNFSDNSQIYDL